MTLKISAPREGGTCSAVSRDAWFYGKSSHGMRRRATLAADSATAPAAGRRTTGKMRKGHQRGERSSFAKRERIHGQVWARTGARSRPCPAKKNTKGGAYSLKGGRSDERRKLTATCHLEQKDSSSEMLSECVRDAAKRKCRYA